MANRSRNYYRKQRRRAIKRKEEIIKRWHQNPEDYFKFHGMASKGKIHCSCQMCSFHATTMQDKRVLVSMVQKVDELEEMCPGESTLINKMRKKINGRWYPNGGISRVMECKERAS